MLYGELGYGELGQFPGEVQLRKNLDKMRKRDGKPKIGTRRWKERAQEAYAAACASPRIREERNLFVRKFVGYFLGENVPS